MVGWAGAMAFNTEKRAKWYVEGCITLGPGLLYGATNAFVGHPMDTVKSKMQAQAGFIKGTDSSMLGVCRRVWRAEGVRGFYRGVSYPLFGSCVYRSLQFAVFEAVYTREKELGWDQALVPGAYGLAWATVAAAMCGASARAIAESPIEYAKVKRQTGQSWEMKKVYQGFYVQFPRTLGMMTFIFCGVDSIARWEGAKGARKPLHQFLTWGGISMLAFWAIWPLETLKNQVQAGTEVPDVASPSLRQRVAHLGGPLGLYRGVLPGSISVFLRNGSAAVVMGVAQRAVTDLGLRS